MSPILKKFMRYSLKILAIVIIIFALLYLALYIYISANKKTIISQVTGQMSEKLNGDVKINNADISIFKSFPKIAVYTQNVLITDTMFKYHKHPFLQVKELFVNLNLFRLMRKQSALSGIRIKDGSIYIFTDSTGYTNKYLMESKKDPAGGPKKTGGDISLNNILIQRMRITLKDDRKKKLYDFNVKYLDVDLKDLGTDLVMKANVDMIVNNLAFKLQKGSFLKGASFAGKFPLKYGKNSQALSFDKIVVKLSGQPFTLSGSFDLGEKNPGFTLKVKSKSVDYEEIKKLLPARIAASLSKVSIDKPLDAEADLYGPLRGREPYILARWKVTKANMKTVFMDFENASFNGYFKNEVTAGLERNDSNSVIHIRDLAAEWHGLPVNSGNIEILNLEKPILTCDIRSAFPLTSLNELVQSESLQLTAGNAFVILAYQGPVERNDNTNSFLNGNIVFSNGKILYAPRNVEMTEVNGKLNFTNSNLIFENIKCKVFNNTIVMNGTAKNALTLISSEPNKVIIDYNIYSPSLNLAPFTALLASRQQKKSAGKNQFSKLASQIDEVLEKSKINVDLRADNLLYNNFKGSGLNAGITILQDRYVINNVNMNLAGGSMAMKGELVSIANNRHQASLSASMQNVDVQNVFYAFKNFGQNGITDKNLKGLLTANANVGIQVSSDGKVLPASSNGTINFSLKKGALNNFEPIKKIQNFIFKNRDFENIEFAELKNKFTINKGEVTINRMEIQSSVLSFFVEGLYSQKGNTDISIQVPLNNLKKRKDDYKPENIGTDKKAGRSIFLRGKPGKDGNIQFKLDLFKKYQKDKVVDSVTNKNR